MRLDFVAFEDFAGNIFGGNLKKQERTIEVPESTLNKIIGSLQESSNTLAIQKIAQELYQK